MSGEKDIAILMADLTGYTAMTEVHGALSAATIVEKYLELAEKAMFGKSRLLERVGDQLVIVSDSADDIAFTALRLMQHTSEEPNFLSIHAGLHFGPVLEKAGSFFGNSINLTARIAAMAKRNSILCSMEFVKTVKEKNQFYFKEIGKVQLKNIKRPVHLAELLPLGKHDFSQIHIDPVCHMGMEANSVHHYTYKEVKYYFCSKNCMQIFLEGPDQLVQH